MTRILPEIHTPLLSVVIPTHKRPEYLPRAVESALTSSPDTVEVIIVPNGDDETWRKSLAHWMGDPRIVTSPLKDPNGNAARNHGLELATGVYIRFLDDDDYLVPDTARNQVEILDREGADMCSGSIRAESRRHHTSRVYQQPDTTDVVIAAFASGRVPHPAAHVFRRRSLNGTRWRNELKTQQDVIWIIDVVASKELRWIKLSDEVGVWFQHFGKRVSRGHDPGGDILKVQADIVCNTYEKLEREERLTDGRKVAIADLLWRLLQKGLRYNPKYWIGIAEATEERVPGRRPPSRIHTWPVFNHYLL